MTDKELTREAFGSDAFMRLKEIVNRLRSEGGCPWDREQTHESLKRCCIEEAAEVVCGVNILTQTGEKDNFIEELGDLMLQVVMNARIAEEEGLFTMDDVLNGVSDKLLRRHPHVFGEIKADSAKEALASWESSKAEEGKNKELEKKYLPAAFEESKALIEAAKKRKGIE